MEVSLRNLNTDNLLFGSISFFLENNLACIKIDIPFNKELLKVYYLTFKRYSNFILFGIIVLISSNNNL